MKSRTIQQKLTVSYTLLIMLIILIIIGALSFVLSGHLSESAERQIDLKLRDITSEVQNQLMEVLALSDDVQQEERILNILEESLTSPNTKEAEIPGLLRSAYSSKNPLIGKMILINRNLQILDPVYTRVVYRDAILTHEAFTDFLEKKYTFYFAEPGTFPIDLQTGYEQDKPTIVLYQRLLDERYWLRGYLLSILRKDMLFKSLWEPDVGEQFAWIGVFSGSMNLIVQSGLFLPLDDIKTAIGPYTEIAPFPVSIGGERYYLSAELIPRVNWVLVGCTPANQVMRDLFIAIRTILVLGIVFMIFAVILSFFLARTITRPLQQITDAMHAYDDNKALEKIDLHVQGELGYLVRVYNRLVENINQYIRSIYEEQEKKKEAELKSLEYELDFLQAQINPHFIYNTLNAIGYQAEKNGNREVYESLKSFNILLKASVSGIYELVPIRLELDLVANFLRIQRLRYGDGFSLINCIPGAMEEALVPKLILQPVVENAVFHGIEPSGRYGKIELHAEKKDGSLILSVSDNGVGIEDVEAAEAMSEQSMGRNFNKIGLANVNERLKILFGPEYGVTISSTSGEGTSVLIEMPYQEE